MARDVSEDFCRRVAQVCPELAELFREHRDYYEEILPHVFFGDVTRFAEHCIETSTGHTNLQALISLLEMGLEEADPYVNNLISVSFIENILFQPRDIALVRSIAGPLLQKEIDEMANWHCNKKGC